MDSLSQKFKKGKEKCVEINAPLARPGIEYPRSNRWQPINACRS